MRKSLPRISRAVACGPTTLAVLWRSGHEDRIDLASWIATGGATLAPLLSPEVFQTPKAGSFGGDIYWGDEDGELAIDAAHLALLAPGQVSSAFRGYSG